MAFSERKLRVKSDGIKHQLFLGKEDISNQVTAVNVIIQAGMPTVATVTMYVVDVDVQIAEENVKTEEIHIDTKQLCEEP